MFERILANQKNYGEVQKEHTAAQKLREQLGKVSSFVKFPLKIINASYQYNLIDKIKICH